MPRTAVSVQKSLITGLAPTYQAGDAVNHHEFINDGSTWIQVKNTGGSPCTVTLVLANANYKGLTLSNPTVSVPATTGDRLIGPFDPEIFNQPGGLAYVNLSTGTGITLAAFNLR